MPAHTPPAGTSGRTWITAYCITASSLLAQWGGTLIHGTGTMSSAHCAALTAHGPVDDQHVPGHHQPRRNWFRTSGVERSRAVTGGTWVHRRTRSPTRTTLASRTAHRNRTMLNMRNR